VLYREILARTDAQRHLYLAVSVNIHETLFLEPIGQLMIDTQSLRLIVFDSMIGKITRWIP
jgi:hypothetical protein